MDRPVEITVPREIVNEDIARIAGWRVSSGDKVLPNETIVLIETSKAILEVEAEAEGYVEIMCPEGAQVRIGETIGLIKSTPMQKGPAKGIDALGAEESWKAANERPDQRSRFSRKALRMIQDHGIDPALFEGKRLVREIDVLDHLRQEEPTQKGNVNQTIARGLWDDARISAKERGKGMIWLAFNYAFRTWLLGNAVRWAPRALILSLHRLRGVRIGNGCFIDASAIIETAYPEHITIGDDVRIAARAVIMTHIKPPHFLREKGLLPSSVDPVVLEDHSFIGVNAVVMPGVTVGKAAVVGSGAVVIGNVPAFTFVAGNPARVVKRLTEVKN